MGDLLNDVKKYLEETPKEKVLEDWNECNNLDDGGVTIGEFIKSNKVYYGDEEDKSFENAIRPYVLFIMLILLYFGGVLGFLITKI